MNEYTRREEVRWILFSAVTLVACVGASMASLVTASGPIVPDAKARAAANDAAAKVAPLDGCSVTATKLAAEFPQFKKVEETAQAAPSSTDPPKQTPGSPHAGWVWSPQQKRMIPPPEPKKTKVDDNSGLAWPGAQAMYGFARELAPCEAAVRSAGPLADDADTGWKAIATVAAVTDPGASDKDAQKAAAKTVYEALRDAPVDRVASSVTDAGKSLQAAADAAAKKADGATTQKPLPRGLLGREVALAAGVLIGLLALLVHFFSLRATSNRRGRLLLALRPSATTAQRGLQAAGLLRLASESNGGEPGMVFGAALGGLLASILARQDADWFVVGVMGGLVIGLLVQIAARAATGPEGRFRARSLELAEVEKPTVPIVLVLETIAKDREDEFLEAFLALTQEQQAENVEKMAQQAEERILVAADALAVAPQAAQRRA